MYIRYQAVNVSRTNVDSIGDDYLTNIVQRMRSKLSIEQEGDAIFLLELCLIGMIQI